MSAENWPDNATLVTFADDYDDLTDEQISGNPFYPTGQVMPDEPGAPDVGMVLVRWSEQTPRSWEYAADLRVLARR